MDSVKEEEELKSESAASVESDAANSRRVYRVAPHYNNNNQSQQLGAAKVASVKTGSGVILVALRQKKKSIKPQQCHRQNMVAQERRGSVSRRNRIPSISAIGSNNDRKCGKKIVVNNVARIIKKTQHRVRGYFLRLNLTKKREI